MAVRRVQLATTGKSDVPLPPAPPPHPGYAPNAAYHAIKKHAAEFVTPKAQAVRKDSNIYARYIFYSVQYVEKNKVKGVWDVNFKKGGNAFNLGYYNNAQW